MPTYHHRRAILSTQSFRALKSALPELGFTKGMTRGFSVGDIGADRVRGRFIFTKTIEVDTIDEDTLAERRAQRQWKKAALFDLVQRREMVWATAVEDLNVLEAALNEIPGVDAHFAAYDLDLGALTTLMQQNFKRNAIEALGIRDYLARENMLATAQFKVLEPYDGDKLRDLFRDQLGAVKVRVILPDIQCKVRITDKGAVQVSDGTPDELLAFIRDLLPRYHRAGE